MIIYQVRYNYEVFIIWSNLILLLGGGVPVGGGGR